MNKSGGLFYIIVPKGKVTVVSWVNDSGIIFNRLNRRKEQFLFSSEIEAKEWTKKLNPDNVPTAKIGSQIFVGKDLGG